MPVSRICSVPVCERVAGQLDPHDPVVGRRRVHDVEPVVGGERGRDRQAEQAALTVGARRRWARCRRCVLAPVAGLRWTMSWASRRLYRIVPSGRVTRPQGMSVSVVTWVTVQTGLVQAAPVVDRQTCCCAMRRWPARPGPPRSTGTSCSAASPLSMNEVAGGGRPGAGDRADLRAVRGRRRSTGRRRCRSTAAQVSVTVVPRRRPGELARGASAPGCRSGTAAA